MPIKDITIEAFRNDYPGHPEKPSFIANVDGIDTYIRVGLKVEDGSIITYTGAEKADMRVLLGWPISITDYLDIKEMTTTTILSSYSQKPFPLPTLLIR